MLRPIAVQTSAGSASHLTGLAFVVDSNGRRNHVILSETIIPSHSVFDSLITTGLPIAVMLDGAFYAIFRATLAMLSSPKDPDSHDPGRLGIGISAQPAHAPSLVAELIVHSLPRVTDDPTDVAARYFLTLAAYLAELEAIWPRLHHLKGPDESLPEERHQQLRPRPTRAP
jgi:alcohol dehydrogenase class IV